MKCPKCGSTNVELLRITMGNGTIMLYVCKDCGHTGWDDFIYDGDDLLTDGDEDEEDEEE